MLPGVTTEEMNIIQKILQNYAGEFFAYGSRVKGGFTALSDLDVLVKSDYFDEIISGLKSAFDSSRLPYIVNFANYSAVDKEFYDLIKNDLVKIK